jgi:UPF0176 protein
MESEKKYFVLAYYHFTTIENPKEEVKKHQKFFENRDVTCRIYLSKEGINGQMSAFFEDANDYMNWLQSDQRFADVVFKIHFYHEQVFPRISVKVREQLVALDAEVDMAYTGEHVSPQRWKEMLEERDQNTLLLDVRNDYEWEVGHFEGSTLPELNTFREFPSYAKNLKNTHDPKKTKVMMCCTGGIRCELYSALLKKEGFENVFQLDGGIINYGLQEGTKHWKGKLFVFDDRLTVPISEKEPAELISHCIHCEVETDLYYNCANMDCNELFLSCPSCAREKQGCCSADCMEAPRVRKFQEATRPKPFRRLSECKENS